jgi:hypothetical protein
MYNTGSYRLPYPCKCNYTQVINNITSLHVDRSDEKRQGANSTKKRKMGEGLKS